MTETNHMLYISLRIVDRFNYCLGRIIFYPLTFAQHDIVFQTLLETLRTKLKLYAYYDSNRFNHVKQESS